MRLFAKVGVLGALTLLSAPKAFALDPDECGKANGRYTNLSFVYTVLDQKNDQKFHSNVGFSFTKGTTYYVTKPISGFLRVGIDATWVDIAYTQYKVEERYFASYDNSYHSIDDYSIHELDFAMQVGVSATANLFKRMQANVYFRYSPTMTLMANAEELQAGFANFFNPGIAVTYGRVGLGIEARFGFSKMQSYFADDDSDDDYSDWTDAIGKRKISTGFSGVRTYLTFRF